jgi:hypothetical protein
VIDTALRDELRDQLRFWVATGDDDLDDLAERAVEAFLDRVDDEGALASAAGDVASAELAAHRAAQAEWSTPTDCDRLDAAFRELDGAGIVARQDFTCCMTCGTAEIGGQVEPDARDVRGFAFYHRQDLETAVERGVLHIAYGAFYREPATEADPAETAAVGREVAAVLEEHGLLVLWDGDIEERIQVPLIWRRRRP